MRRIKEKKERALGVKLFLKAERCSSQKCVTVRRPGKPGQHGNRRSQVTEYGKQLQEKQKIQIFFGLNNKQVRVLFGKEDDPEKIKAALRERLDFVTYLLGFAKSPRIARQMVSHGHILVNGRKVTVGSFRVKKNDVIEIRPESRNSKLFEGIKDHLSHVSSPTWLKLDPNNLKGQCVASSTSDTSEFPFDVALVGQFYSRN
ncbi:30S ribosomal protein S4 [Candidatus Parcubacteria bacterium]|jgi:small subunit ribosomal protein S4|nr:MAG: 30S ribosomal protein S4 [Candidatus Parcubacteria bacterium]